MASNIDKLKKEVQDLLDQGINLFDDLQDEKKEKKVRKGEDEPGFKFKQKYQVWYTKALAVVKQLVVNRYDEFIELYSGDKKRKKITNETYTIKDWLVGLRIPIEFELENKLDDLGVVIMRFFNQLKILESALARFDSSVFDIKQLLQADLYDSETSIARDLHKKGFLRPAGVVVGVLLEKHLSQVCDNHGIVLIKKDPTIADLNESLKKSEVIDIPAWRGIQRLGDLRNLCGHHKDREPTVNEVLELIDGVEKTIKTLF